MKIACIISDINKAVFFEKTALALREEGLEICYIVLNYETGAFVDFLKAHNFHHYTIKSGKLSKSWPQIVKVRKILRQEQISMVHCHLAQANWIGLWAAYLNRIPVRVYTRHSGEPLKLMWKERLIDYIQNRLATKIISISEVIDQLLEKQNVPVYKRTVIHHGFELSRFIENDQQELERIRNDYNPNKNSPVIGVIARWMKWKGIQDIIEAFLIVLETHPNALLCLFGATGVGDYHENISRLLHKVPAKNIRIVAFENNVFDLYQLFDIYVHTPINPTCEAFGQTYIEALASRIPSVFTPSGIAQEFMTSGKHAILVPFQNPQAIADGILELLNNPELAEKLKENGGRAVKELFDFSVYQRNLTQFYHSCDTKLFKSKIIYVISDVNRAVYFEQTAMALRDMNYEIIFVLIGCKNSPFDEFLKANNFQRYYLNVNKLIRSSGTIRELRKIFKYEKPKLIHCHLSKANWVGLNAAWLAGIKNRMYTRHSGKPLHQSRKELFIDRIQNKISTHIIAISENISKLLTEQNIRPEKQTLIHHGFAIERFQNNDPEEVKRILDSYNPERRAPVIGVISRWMELKGMDYIVEAFSRILTDYPDALLCLFGENNDGEYAQRLRSKLEQIPKRNVCIVSFENNCFDLYRLFDIYIHVPVNETCEAFGQTYIEALASGIPSIFSLSGVSGEFIKHRENALVVPFKDAKSIENSIRELLTDEKLRKLLSENGKTGLDAKFSLQYYIQNLSHLYHEKIGKVLP